MINVENIVKEYRLGEHVVRALDGVSLTIEPGDFVAVMGPSGSGKSTLTQILGLLDTFDSGIYRLHGKDISDFDDNELAALRSEEMGFIFQQFNLLPRTSAVVNVALPLLYTRHAQERRDRPASLLAKVGLGERLEHRSNELSGGQQQRVAIARALVNQPNILIADEPTGNLDSKSEAEIMAILQDLNDQGITVIMVTHEEEVAQQARRIIRMRDGKIQSDTRLRHLPTASTLEKAKKDVQPRKFSPLSIFSHFSLGFRSLLSNKVRTGLSMLGIMIGVAAVIAVLALGAGAQQAIKQQLSSLGSNLLNLRPGAVRGGGGVMLDAGSVTRLTIDDAEAIKNQVPFVKATTSNVSGRGQVTFQNKNWSTQIQGVEHSYEKMRDATPSVGRFFTQQETQARARVAVIGMTLVRELFSGKNPIGEMIKINKINFQVIGVLPEKGSNGWRDQDDTVVVPVTAAMYRLFGKIYVENIDIEIDEIKNMETAQEQILALMQKRHRVRDELVEDSFQIRNMADIQAAVSESGKTMSTLLAAIAGISLLVGGIGIMNIMLVSVTERTKEIGLRKAVGATRVDVLMQFMVESVTVTIVGGLFGIILGSIMTFSLSSAMGWSTQITVDSILLSCVFSVAIGMIFGIYPAQKASRLHPIQALRYE